MATTTRSISTTRAEFDQFWDEVLGDSWCIEESSIDEVEWDALDETEVVTVTWMDLVWQGPGRRPEPTRWIRASDLAGRVDVFELWDRWKSRPTFTTIVAEVPADAVDSLVDAIRAAGGTVRAS